MDSVTRDILRYLRSDGGWCSTREIMAILELSEGDVLEKAGALKEADLVTSDNQGPPWWRALSKEEREAG